MHTVSVNQFGPRLDAGKECIAESQAFRAPALGCMLSGSRARGSHFLTETGLLRYRRHVSCSSIILFSKACQSFIDLGQKLLRVIAGEIHEPFERSAGELGRLLDLPVSGDETGGLALGQVAVLAELRRNFLHADPVRNEWRGH